MQKVYKQKQDEEKKEEPINFLLPNDAIIDLNLLPEEDPVLSLYYSSMLTKPVCIILYCIVLWTFYIFIYVYCSDQNSLLPDIVQPILFFLLILFLSLLHLFVLIKDQLLVHFLLTLCLLPVYNKYVLCFFIMFIIYKGINYVFFFFFFFIFKKAHQHFLLPQFKCKPSQ